MKTLMPPPTTLDQNRAPLPFEYREAFRRLFGVSAGSKRGPAGVGADISVAWLRSPLGPLLAAATSQGVCLLEFTEPGRLEAQCAALRRCFETPVTLGSNEHLVRLDDELDAYFAGRLREFTVPLDYRGTPFQRRVWEGLLAIPYGETRSYEELALAIGAPRGQRAVGRANGLNRVAIVIPCHRVINKGGRLGGYGGGLPRKEYLLRLEQPGERRGVSPT